MTTERGTRRLGRGLEALLSGRSETATAEANTGGLVSLNVASVRPNPLQPRHDFGAEELHALEESMRASGLLQPITVRRAKAGSYELVAGERRLRAAKNLGWQTIPAVLKEVSDTDMLTLALIENLQRSDLNAIEEAEGYRRLAEEFGLTQQQIADVVGRDRSTVANALRVLHLPPEVQQMVRAGELSAGQVRPLIALTAEDAIQSARRIAKEQLSARQVERLVRGTQKEAKSSETPHKAARLAQRAEISRLENALMKHLQTDVRISANNENRGTVTVSFYSAEDFERIAQRMGVELPSDDL